MYRSQIVIIVIIVSFQKYMNLKVQLAFENTNFYEQSNTQIFINNLTIKINISFKTQHYISVSNFVMI